MNILAINMLANLKDASLHNRTHIVNKSNKYSYSLLKMLKKFGFISSYRFFRNKNNVLVSEVFLKYGPSGKAAFKNIKIFSKPAKSVWVSYRELLKAQSLLEHGVLFLESSGGVISHKEAISSKKGGKLLFFII